MQSEALNGFFFFAILGAANLTRQCQNSLLNGGVYFVVPGKFIIFHSQSTNPPPDRPWVDNGAVRTFSASFYADLLQDLGVSQVNANYAMFSRYDSTEFQLR